MIKNRLAVNGEKGPVIACVYKIDQPRREQRLGSIT